jgi:hypothetical protein
VSLPDFQNGSDALHWFNLKQRELFDDKPKQSDAELLLLWLDANKGQISLRDLQRNKRWDAEKVRAVVDAVNETGKILESLR